MWRQLIFTAILAHTSFGVWAAAGKADTYPTKPIRLIVGFPAGGSDDYMARVIGPKVTDRLGQMVIVDNRPGAAPAAAIRLLNGELQKIARMDDVKAKFAAQGLEAAGSTPEEFKTLLEAEVKQWGRIIKEAGITLN